MLGDLLIDVRSAAQGGPAVVILHGFKGFKDWGMFPVLAERLARAGFTAVSWNASGSGVDDTGSFVFPERFGHNTFSAEVADLMTVLDALAAGTLTGEAPTSTGLVGHSRGGGIAVLGAAARPEVRALVTWAAVASVQRWPAETRRRWREAGNVPVTNQRTGEVLPLYTDVLDDIERNAEPLDIEAAAARLVIPWKIIHGTADETVPLEEGKRLSRANPRAELHLVERAGHTFGAVHPLTTRPATLEEVLDTTTAFLSRYL